jgi:hypothetical protein
MGIIVSIIDMTTQIYKTHGVRHNVPYTTDTRTRSTETSILLNNIQSNSEKKLIFPHPKLLIPSMEFTKPVSVNETDFLTLCVMDLLVSDVYPVLKGYAKANIIFYLKHRAVG